ncbi:MAG: 16S rRNA (uracil(1498)-N(3))-methyltransferase, partial [Sulfurimonas sp.]|nr:16S rRNA (uracil(1498)-N(3))-methyltransferase [Sulfurimonas sp.]
MIYIFDTNAGTSQLTLKGELHKYLIKVRRHSIGDFISFRNRENIELLHKYKILNIEPRIATLELVSSELNEIKADKELHVAWCIIDSKSVEKVLPSLCEIGVSRISFISCERSQKSFKIDFKRYERIVEASMQQSGRTSFMSFDTYKNISSFIEEFPDTKVFDFTQNILKDSRDFRRVLIGCEGGFSEDEKKLLQKQEVFRLNSKMVLRSESA